MYNRRDRLFGLMNQHHYRFDIRNYMGWIRFITLYLSFNEIHNFEQQIFNDIKIESNRITMDRRINFIQSDTFYTEPYRTSISHADFTVVFRIFRLPKLRRSCQLTRLFFWNQYIFLWWSRAYSVHKSVVSSDGKRRQTNSTVSSHELSCPENPCLTYLSSFLLDRVLFLRFLLPFSNFVSEV